MDITQALPTEASDDGDLARQLLTILGPFYQAPDGSNNAADALAIGGALADVRAVLTDALSEAFVTDAWDLLSELEAVYGLTVRADLSPAARQARLTAKVRAARAGSPQDILRAIRVYDPNAQLYENLATDVPRESDSFAPFRVSASRTVYQFAITVAAAIWNDPSKLAEIMALVRQMKPSHTRCFVTVNVGFLTDDPNSLTDRDVLGE